MTEPIIRQSAIRLRVTPNIPIPLWVVAGAATFEEPRVLVGTVIRHEVEDDFEITIVRFMHQYIEISKCSEQRVHAAIIGNVIAEISHG